MLSLKQYCLEALQTDVGVVRYFNCIPEHLQDELILVRRKASHEKFYDRICYRMLEDLTEMTF